MRIRTIVVAVFFLACAGPAGAQNLTLEFRDGRVSIDAANVPVRTLLSEWARLGGTKVVGVERLSGAPLTLHLESVPEAQALEVVLRNVAGYMAAPRQAGSAGASAYDRILVMPTSSAPAATASNSRPAAGNPNTARNPRGPFGPPQPTEPDSEPVQAPMPDAADTGVNEPPFQFPQQNPFGAPVQQNQAGPFGTPVQPGAQPPVIQFGQGAGQGVSINPAPNQPMPVLQFPGAPAGTSTTPGFGVGSPTPGMIVQPASPQPGQPARPPGGDGR